MNIALILAGGTGSRAGTEVPKQFFEINGKPLIIYTMEVFEQCRQIDGICVICLKSWIGRLRDYAERFGISKLQCVCEGGQTGLESVERGIRCLENYRDSDLILIHDAVRPFVDQETLEDNIEVASKYGLAMACVDCVETLVYSKDGLYAQKSIARDGIKRVLTPQTFRLQILRDMLKKEEVKKNREPSVFALYMRQGNPIYCSKSNNKNIKITYPQDIEYFKKMFE